MYIMFVIVKLDFELVLLMYFAVCDLTYSNLVNLINDSDTIGDKVIVILMIVY